MSARLRTTAGAAALAFALATPLFAQSVLLRLNPAEGLVSRYVVSTETYMDNPMISLDGPLMTAEMFQTHTVLSVAGDVVELRTVTDSTNVTSAMPGAPIPDLDGTAYTIKFDSRGRIVEMTDIGDLSPESQAMVEQIGGAGFGVQLPEDAVSPGDTWTANINLDVPAGMGSSMALDMDITYTLVSVDGDLAKVSFEGPITMSGGAGGMTMDGTGGLSGTVVLDVAKGRVQDTESQMSLDISVAGMTMSMDTNNTMRLIP